VDILNTLTLPQLILIMSLCALLISWLVIFAYLAIRPTTETYPEQMEHTTTLPVNTSPVMPTFPMTSRTQGRHTISQQTSTLTIVADSTHEMVIDRSRH
jgi:hypothetical protein